MRSALNKTLPALVSIGIITAPDFAWAEGAGSSDASLAVPIAFMAMLAVAFALLLKLALASLDRTSANIREAERKIDEKVFGMPPAQLAMFNDIPAHRNRIPLVICATLLAVIISLAASVRVAEPLASEQEDEPASTPHALFDADWASALPMGQLCLGCADVGALGFLLFARQRERESRNKIAEVERAVIAADGSVSYPAAEEALSPDDEISSSGSCEDKPCEGGEDKGAAEKPACADDDADEPENDGGDGDDVRNRNAPVFSEQTGHDEQDEAIE